jgi:hypothetical protein
MTAADIARIQPGTALVYRQGALEQTVYLADRRCRRCGRVKVWLEPRRGPWWLVLPANLRPNGAPGDDQAITVTP